MAYTPGPWRYEIATKTVRAIPGNYWIATLDSFDGVPDHLANAKLIAAAPDLLAALRGLCYPVNGRVDLKYWTAAREAMRKAEGYK